MPIKRLAPVLFVCALSAGAQPPADGTVRRIHAHEAYHRAAAVLDRDYTRFVDDTIALTEIPAPPFKEAARAAAFLTRLQATRLTAVEQDAAGNVLGLRPGSGGPLLVVSAHLDTVFPEGTDVTVRRNGTRLSAPGIGDNGQGLALLLALIRAMDEGRVATTSDILFAAIVGEEGAGDLRGVRHLFTSGRYKDRIRSFISIDGTGHGTWITNAGIGSLRYRVSFTGPGGHSYGAFGTVNPAHALANAIQKLGAVKVPATPKTTYNVGTLGGGTSVNAIPSDAWMEVDLRSESAGELSRLDAAFRQLIDQAAAEENRARSTTTGRIVVDLKPIGSRPTGQTPAQSELVRLAMAATRAMGGNPQLGANSTDSNFPMSLGIPAITIDTGVSGGRAHSPDEWIDVDRRSSFTGMARALLLILSIAGLN